MVGLLEMRIQQKYIRKFHGAEQLQFQITV